MSVGLITSFQECEDLLVANFDPYNSASIMVPKLWTT
jgi:hypothetical protein